jgi:subtilase family serine protease
MAWSASAIFQQAMLHVIAYAGATTTSPASMSGTGLLGDTVNVALYGTLTPDKTATAANTQYGGGVWSGTEITSTNWAAGGIATTSTTYAIDSGSSSIIFHSGSTAGGGVVTLTAFFGCMVYDNTLTSTYAKQGLCYNYFGGTNTVTGGNFTILWATPVSAATTAVFNIAV